MIANPGEPDKEGDIDGLQATAAETGGTFAQLGTGGSAEDVVEAINELEAAKIERPPLVQTLDEPRTGQVIAGIGVGLLVLVWAAQGLISLAGRRSSAMSTALVLARRIGIVVALVLVLLQPGFGTRAAPTQLSDIEVLVVVDRTRSMAALDYQGGPRVYGAQRDLAELADALPGARFALLTYGSDVELELPFTSDATTFGTAIETLRLEGPFDGSGSLADRPLEAMREILERADEQHPDRRRMVVYVSDGENTADGEQASFSELEDLVDGGVVLGYGTEEGAKMPEADNLSTEDGYVYDQDKGEDAISRIDEDNLEAIAAELGIDYAHRTEPGGMRALADDFEASYALDEGADAPAEHDLTWLFGLILLGLVLLELRTWWRALWTSHTALAPARKEAT